MKLLKLSKVVRAPVPMVAMRPPLGASGLTQPKCAKSAGYFRSPNADNPCRPPSAATLVDRQAQKATEHVPHRQPIERHMPLRHHVVVPEQHAVERTRRRHQAVPVGSQDDLVD